VSLSPPVSFRKRKGYRQVHQSRERERKRVQEREGARTSERASARESGRVRARVRERPKRVGGERRAARSGRDQAAAIDSMTCLLLPPNSCILTQLHTSSRGRGAVCMYMSAYLRLHMQADIHTLIEREGYCRHRRWKCRERRRSKRRRGRERREREREEKEELRKKTQTDRDYPDTIIILLILSCTFKVSSRHLWPVIHSHIQS
jgi:hypothetical protein